MEREPKSGQCADGPDLLTEDSEFCFECHDGLPCFGRCCADVNLYLTPIDIVEMRRALGISSADFLRKFALPLFPREVGHPVVVLRMMDTERRCPFSGKTGCRIYRDRPWSCRSFPLEPLDNGSRVRKFRVVRREFCEGLKGESRQEVSAWRKSQEVSLHETLNHLWATVTHHPGVNRVNLLEGSGRDIFFLASYNPDEFRRTVFDTDFLRYFEIPADTLKKVRTDDIELLSLAFRWLRTVLFGDNSLPRTRPR